MINNYELMVILDSEQSTEEQEKLITKIEKYISENEGELKDVKEWGKKQLEYPILKKTSGVFHLFYFSAPKEKIASIKQKIKLEGNIMRFLLVVSNKGGK